jgi:hypothetical protein
MAITGCQLQNVTAARRQLEPLVGGPRAAPARSVPSTRRRPGFRGRSIPSHEGANHRAPVARVCGQEAGRLQAPVTAHSYPEASGPGNTPQPASLRCCQNGERPVQEEPSRRQGRSGNHARQPPRPAGPGAADRILMRLPHMRADGPACLQPPCRTVMSRCYRRDQGGDGWWARRSLTRRRLRLLLPRHVF